MTQNIEIERGAATLKLNGALSKKILRDGSFKNGFLIIHPGYSIVGQRLALQEADPLLGEAELADAATGHC